MNDLNTRLCLIDDEMAKLKSVISTLTEKLENIEFSLSAEINQTKYGTTSQSKQG